MIRTGRPSSPVALRRRSAAHERDVDDLGLAVAVDVERRARGGPSARRTGVVHASTRRRASCRVFSHCSCAGVRGVERLPGRAEHEVGQAVAVDVDGRDAHVVRRRLAVEDDPLLPRFGFSYHTTLMLIDHHDVGLLVAVDVGDEDRVADLQPGVDLLRFELREVGGE